MGGHPAAASVARRAARAAAGVAAPWIVLPGLLAGQEVDLRWNGDVRIRTEVERPASTGEGDAFTLLRTRLGMRARVARGALLYAQVQDARIFGEESSTSDASADAFDLHQGYIELAWRGEDLGGWLRAGRQEIHAGNGRLVGASQWGNAGRSFDGLRGEIAPASGTWASTVFIATLRERGNRYGSAETGSGGDHALLGFLARGGPVEGFVYHDAGARFRSFEGVHRTTLGGRLLLPRTDLEGVWQRGRQRHVSSGEDPVRQEIGAWFVSGRVRLLGAPEGDGGRLLAGAEYLSGDRDPTDSRYGAFHTMYPSSHDLYGLMDLFPEPSGVTGERGLLDLMLRSTLPAAGGLPAWLGAPLLDLHRFSLAETDGGPGELGWELDLVVPLQVMPGARVSLGYGAFLNGAAAPRIGFGADGSVWHWVYLQGSVAF